VSAFPCNRYADAMQGGVPLRPQYGCDAYTNYCNIYADNVNGFRLLWLIWFCGLAAVCHQEAERRSQRLGSQTAGKHGPLTTKENIQLLIPMAW